jgi:phosphatidate cytidylyltransferase
MLGQRIVTAIVLLALLIPALWSDAAWPFPMLTLAFLAAAGWEWARLNGTAGPPAAAWAAAVVLAGLLAWWAMQTGTSLHGLVVLAALAWLFGGPWALRAGIDGWSRAPASARRVLGLGVVIAAWVALVEARVQGLGFVLSVFCTVWVADIAAYAGGRAFGRRKLAPRISPGKSWEGAVCGVLAVWLLAWGWWALQSSWPALGPSLFSALNERFGPGPAILLLTGLVAMSVVGDLFESLLKRAAHVKDSSRLLPGHGGVLDRIDALLPVFPLALALTWR